MAQQNSDDTKKLLILLVDALDEEMLKSLLAKNLHDNFELLFLKYNVLIYKRAYKMMRNHEDAEDILQETFINAFQDMLKHPEKILLLSSLNGWLYTITKHLVINRKRKEKKDLLIDSIEGLEQGLCEDDTSKEPELATLAAEHERCILECVKMLPEKYRTLVKVYLVYDVKYSEMAKMTGKSVAVTKSLLAEGIELLRKKINEINKIDKIDTNQNIHQKLAS
jgi:RNA polymerase sigma-70 factor (ECF subfamily)